MPSTVSPKIPFVYSSQMGRKAVHSYFGFLFALFIRLFLLFALGLSIGMLIYLFLYTNPKMHKFEIHFKNIHQEYSVLAPMNKCPEATKLLILVMTRRTAFTNRDAIRETWAKNMSDVSLIRFLIADPPIAKGSHEIQSLLEEQTKLEAEQSKFGDLIEFRGFEDSYANLHLKWYAALEWQQNFCPSIEFVLKTDDDTVVHLDRLAHWIEHKFGEELMAKNSAIYFGYLIWGKKPIRDKGHKWQVPKSAYPEESYPDYLQGATYLASVPAVTAVMRHAPEVNGFNMDDVLFTGILAQRANVTLSDAGEHFRVGNKLSVNEKCVNGTPVATALFGASDIDQFREIYTQLDQIECDNE